MQYLSCTILLWLTGILDSTPSGRNPAEMDLSSINVFQKVKEVNDVKLVMKNSVLVLRVTHAQIVKGWPPQYECCLT